MKHLFTFTTLMLALLLFPLSTYSQKTKNNKEHIAQFVDGEITIKLIEGIGDYTMQSGMIHFGIPSLDEKVQEFGIYRLEKRFKYNKAKLRSDLPDLSRIYKLSYSGNYKIQQVVAAFAQNPNVEYAEGIPYLRPDIIPDDSMYDECQHLPQIQAEDAWDIHIGEDGTEEIVIAIVDEGVSWRHEDLVANTFQNLGEDADGDGVTIEFNAIDGEWVLDPDDLDGIDDDGNGYIDDLAGWNFINEDGDPSPTANNNQHGTHCAGIACATTNNNVGISSVSYNIKHMGVCMSAGDDGGPFAYDAIIYAAEMGADIISFSWGGWQPSQADQESIHYAYGLGSIIVTSAGNTGVNVFRYPSSYLNVVAVANVFEDDVINPSSTHNLAVDIAAPGTGILSTVYTDEYESWTGTSMACPMISGSIGLLKSYHPDWTNLELMNQVIGTADEIDDLNPGYEYLIGSGRVNAYEMLAGELEDPYLKLGHLATHANDANGNDINEQGELVTINVDGRNFMQTYSADDVTVTLSTTDPDLTITDGDGVLNIVADTIFNIIDQFQVQVSNDATPHFAELNVHFEADIGIPIGSDMTISILIAPDGFLVYEGEENETGYSGKYIADILDRLGYPYVYTATFPNSLIGFESVFLSFANVGENLNQGSAPDQQRYILLQDYLEQGGKMYMEVGGVFMGSSFNEYPNAEEMEALFGIESPAIIFEENIIDSLIGATGSPMEGIVFTSSDQVYNWYIDDLTPMDGVTIPFYESDYGNVSIMNVGPDSIGHKTFYLGYALAELKDHSAMGSRNNVLLKVIDFLNDSLPEGYALSNFLVDYLPGAAPLEASFNEISLSDTLYDITSWKWDFENDGVIDSEEQNPTWTYTEGGVYTVSLIVSNGMDTDTLIREQLIEVNSGYLSYEGDSEGADYSGEYIYDYLIDNGYEAHYRSEFPQSLLGFETVFLSFGNYNSGYTQFTDNMVEVVVEYLEAEGYVYLEGGDALGFDQANDDYLHELFGLSSIADGSTNPIDSLFGQEESNAITVDMLYTGNSQESNSYIDRFTPSVDGVVAFVENNYGNVAVQSSIPNSRRTFCFSYALSKLDDGEDPSTKEELMNRLLYFFSLASSVNELIVEDAFNISVYPNPTNTGTTLQYQMSTGTNISLRIMNSQGQIVEEQLDQFQGEGQHEYYWNAEEMPAGVYYYTLQSDKHKSTGKIIKLR